MPTFEFGVPFVVEALWERLQLGPALRKAMEQSGGGTLHERALLAMAANRLREPGSKLGVWDRWLEKTHTGTHIDAPWHFNKKGRRIDELPVEAFMGEAVVVDFRAFKDCQPIKREDLEKATPQIQEGDILIINTGWHKRYGAPEYNTKHPGIDGESVETLLLEKKIKMVGMDTMCVEVGDEFVHWPHPLHRVCLIENEIPLIENLGGNIDQVTGKRCFIMAFPLKLMADAGIARVVALLKARRPTRLRRRVRWLDLSIRNGLCPVLALQRG